LKLGISVPVRGENSDMLINAETDKNDYDWLVALFLFLAIILRSLVCLYVWSI